MTGRTRTTVVCAAIVVGGAWGRAAAQVAAQGSFAEAVALVDKHSHAIVLSTEHGASVAVWPAMQGRVLTSSVDGGAGRGFGWINRELIASGGVQPHMNAVGGEDRLWLGPEGGQFGIFFAPGAPFDLEHWFTPAPVDTEAFDVTSQTAASISLRKTFSVRNYSGTSFHVQVDRAVKLLPDESIWKDLAMSPATGVQVVGFESENKLTNVGSEPWIKRTGLLSLWVLGQFQAVPEATIILPLRPAPGAAPGSGVKTDYFGTVPADRIHFGEKAVLFKADAKYRSKLGVSLQRSTGRIGSYDPEHHVLTIVQYGLGPPSASYVNSAWGIQKEPYKGDVANCYNDGVPSLGKPQLGQFYELESSSAAAELAPHASVTHTQRTIHLVGPADKLDAIAVSILGVHLSDVLAFNHP
jgi:hypothetical protein